MQRETGQKTYSTWDSLVVTDPTTSQAIGGLSRGERTGSRAFHHLWPYVLVDPTVLAYIMGIRGVLLCRLLLGNDENNGVDKDKPVS